MHLSKKYAVRTRSTIIEYWCDCRVNWKSLKVLVVRYRWKLTRKKTKWTIKFEVCVMSFEPGIMIVYRWISIITNRLFNLLQTTCRFENWARPRNPYPHSAALRYVGEWWNKWIQLTSLKSRDMCDKAKGDCCWNQARPYFAQINVYLIRPGKEAPWRIDHLISLRAKLW